MGEMRGQLVFHVYYDYVSIHCSHFYFYEDKVDL